MKLSSQKDLLLVIILSAAVLITNWAGLLKGYPLSILPTVLILFLPGYAIITSIWPSDEKMTWSLRAGIGFVLGLFFVLFIPLIASNMKWGFISSNLNEILFLVAIIMSLVAMLRRRKPEDYEKPRDAQLTLEESIERATLMRQKAEAEANEYEDHYDEEYYEEEHPGEDYPEDEYSGEEYSEDEHFGEEYPEDEHFGEEYPEDEDFGEEYPEDKHSREGSPEKEFSGEVTGIEDNGKTRDELTKPGEDEVPGFEDLKKEKPLQYERLKDRYSLEEDSYSPDEDRYSPGKEYPDEHPLEDHEKLPDEEPLPRGVPLSVEEPVKTIDYEAEMDRPVWMDEPEEKKPGFRNWDLVMILFLSGISLLFLYFNPLKTTTTSIIFFILLLFILGYAGLTIIYPDKSRVSTSKLILATSIIALILFLVSFLAWWMHLLPAMPKYLVQIMFVASVIMSAGAFIRKWRANHEVTPEVDEDIPAPETYEEDIREEIPDTPKKIPVTTKVTPEKVPLEETPRVTGDEILDETPGEEEKEEKEKGLVSLLKSLVKSTKTTEVVEETPEEELQAVKEDLEEEKVQDKMDLEEEKSQDKEDLEEKEPHKAPPAFKPRNHYLDIVLMVALTLLTAAFVLIKPLNQTFIRTILGILLVLFIPGYTLIAALFPKWGDLDGIERGALSFGLSIAVTPLIGLALNYTPWGIRLDPILISLTMFTLAMCLIAFWRRSRLPEEERYFVPFGEFYKDIRNSFQAESGTERILSIILIISIILAISTTAYIIVKPKEGEKFTEFYILGPDGKASNYPTNLTTGQNGSLTMGVVNHEYATTDYLLLVKVNSSILYNQTLTLTSGQKVEVPFSFTAGTPGQKKMEFLLYKLPDKENAYRSLHLWLDMK